MRAWWMTLIGASVVAANGAVAIANVTITGQRKVTNPLPSPNLSHDLRMIAYASLRPLPLKYPVPLSQTGEIQLPGAFNVNDPRRLDGTPMSPTMDIACSPMFRECQDPEISGWSGAGVSALRFNLGASVDVDTFTSARLEMNRILQNSYGAGDASDPGFSENRRVDGMVPKSLDELDIFAGTAL